jgi:hypothetical protein
MFQQEFECALNRSEAEVLRTGAGVLLLFSLFGFPSGASTDTELKLPGPPAQKMILGSWLIRVQYEPTQDLPKGDVGIGEERWYPGPGGFSLIEELRERNSKGEISGLAVFWWDDKISGIRVLWCENSNPSGCSLPGGARWEGNNLVLDADHEIAGKKLRFREVFSDITPKSFKQTVSMGETDAELKPFIRVSATRK